MKLIEELKASAVEPNIHFELAWAYAGNDNDRALQELKRAVESHFILPEHLRNSFVFGSVQSDPRFIAILDKVGLLPSKMQ